VNLVVFGNINMDLTTYAARLPRPGETLHGKSFKLAPGGKGANQAAAAARLGVPTRFFGRIGDDDFGRQAVEALRAYGVDTSVKVDPQHSTGLAVISVDEAGENAITSILGANMAMDDTDVERAAQALPEAGLVLLQLEIPLPTVIAMAGRAAAGGLPVVLDPAPAPAHPLPDELIRHLYALTPNEVEAEALVGYPVDDLESAARAARQLHGWGVPLSVVKLGSRGAYFATEDEEGHIPAFPVKAVDSVAAGDAFNGALAAALLEGRPTREALRWAAAGGALAVTRAGAMPSMPSRAELEALLKQDG
jgi:ribokinase